MWYIKILIIPLYLASSQIFHFPVANGILTGHSVTRECPQKQLYAQSAPVLIAQNNRANASGQEQSDRSSEDKESEIKQENNEPEENRENHPQKDFVPSEQIEAEKAVDFPTDI
ncbi:MAG: hypothetical protein MRJ65_08090 [Candidatus Brocadiaceae bacterium]|nr:hypothetical protein [Candidatus Brocadiaceae bacterium]